MNNSTINLLIQLKNASKAFKEIVDFPYNNLAAKLTKVLYRQGLVQFYKITTDNAGNKVVRIGIRYRFGKAILHNFEFLSRPSTLKYVSLKDLYKIKEKKRIIFVSTSLGFLTSLECKKLKVGGKFLFAS